VRTAAIELFANALNRFDEDAAIEIWNNRAIAPLGSCSFTVRSGSHFITELDHPALVTP
jgi:hypothetical protein